MVDRPKPDIQLGAQVMYGRNVIVQELQEPVKVNPYDLECNWYYYFVVVELGTIKEKKAWLWDGWVVN